MRERLSRGLGRKKREKKNKDKVLTFSDILKVILNFKLGFFAQKERLIYF